MKMNIKFPDIFPDLNIPCLLTALEKKISSYLIFPKLC